MNVIFDLLESYVDLMMGLSHYLCFDLFNLGKYYVLDSPSESSEVLAEFLIVITEFKL